MKSNRQRNKKRNKDIIAWLLISISLSIISVIGWFLYDYNQSKIKVDDITHCPVEGSPEFISIIFDKSDSFNKIQQSFLQRYFTQLKANLKVGTHLSIYSINEKQDKNTKPSFIICSPSTGEDANFAYQNPEKIKKKWKDKFEKPLDDQITSFMKPSMSNSSPIMEMFQIVALSTPTNAARKPKRMIIISDMLQHTPKWSHYKGQYDIEKLKKSSYLNKIRTDLDNTEVTILLVRREGYESLQTKKLAYFWADYVQLMNGQVKAIEQIDG